MSELVEFHVAGTVRIDIESLVAKGVKAIEVHSMMPIVCATTKEKISAKAMQVLCRAMKRSA